MEDKYPIIMHRPSEAVSFGASRFAGASRFGYGDGVAHKEDTKEESENKEIETEEKKPVTEEEDDNVKNTNPVLEQQTDRCYGIWYPSEGKLEGEIRFLVTQLDRQDRSAQNPSHCQPVIQNCDQGFPVQREESGAGDRCRTQL